MKVCIVGLGLIGGSFALALRRHSLAESIVGIESNPKHVEQALSLGIVDSVVDINQAVEESDLIVLAIPVDAIPQMAMKVLNRIKSHQTLIDMGSTKEELCEIVSQHPSRARLVATHPMWGTEYSGPSAATADSFAGRNVVLCEVERSAGDAVQLVSDIYRKLGMNIMNMSAEQHDIHAAYVSHISHITSFVLSTTVLEKEREEDTIFNLAGGGFDSTVRLAKSEAKTWVPIFAQNKYNVLDVLREYIHQLQLFRKALEKDDYESIYAMIHRANDIRKVLEEKRQR